MLEENVLSARGVQARIA